ncbi:MAG: ADP-ribosylglycohydrolase family protein [Verrucomicrobium sp.]
MTVNHEPSSTERLQGLILGAALGDALGLPAEGLSRGRIARLWSGALRHRFLAGRGMGSDDTEHLFLTGQALLQSRLDVEAFRKSLGWKLRWWMLAFPAGVGLATARALLKLWLGWKPGNNGVYSAGNGPAMRSAVIGAVCSQDLSRLRGLVEASTTLTHTDPKALTGALALAHAAAAIHQGNASPADLFEVWRHIAPDDKEWQSRLILMEGCLTSQDTVEAFVTRLGCPARVSGYMYHSVPVALYSWLTHRGDFRETVTQIVRCGGDTDTVASMAGALAGMEAGIDGLPQDWMAGLTEWPRTKGAMMALGLGLSTPLKCSPVSYPVWGVLPRNLLFLAVVLFHGFRRLLPPY